MEDPRRGRPKCHELLDIIVINLCAVVCGADNWVEIEEFGKTKGEWFPRLPNGIPSHDTFGRVFGMLDPERFAACFTPGSSRPCNPRSALPSMAMVASPSPRQS